jgi:hypothetical protein
MSRRGRFNFPNPVPNHAVSVKGMSCEKILQRLLGSVLQLVLISRRRDCTLARSIRYLTVTSAHAHTAADTHSPLAGIALGPADHVAHLVYERMLEDNVPRLLFDGEYVFQSAPLAIYQLLHGAMVSLKVFEVDLEPRFVRFGRFDGKPQYIYRPRLLAKDFPALMINRAEK